MSKPCAYAKRIRTKKYCITLVHFLNVVPTNCIFIHTQLHKIHPPISIFMISISMIDMCIRCFVRCPKHVLVPHNFFSLKPSELKGDLVASLWCCIFKEQRYIKSKKIRKQCVKYDS